MRAYVRLQLLSHVENPVQVAVWKIILQRQPKVSCSGHIQWTNILTKCQIIVIGPQSKWLYTSQNNWIKQTNSNIVPRVWLLPTSLKLWPYFFLPLLTARRGENLETRFVYNSRLLVNNLLSNNLSFVSLISLTKYQFTTKDCSSRNKNKNKTNQETKICLLIVFHVTQKVCLYASLKCSPPSTHFL